MIDTESMKSLLAHIRSRRRLGERAKPETYVKLVLGILASDTPVTWLAKRHHAVINELRSYRHQTIQFMVESGLNALGWGKLPSAFDAWFQQQFGPPVFKDPLALERAREEFSALDTQLGEKRRRLARHEQYEEHKRAALYAWQARGVSPKGIAKAKPR